MKIILVFLLLYSSIATAQPPAAGNDLDFVVNKIKTHYPPFIDKSTARRSARLLARLDKNPVDTFAALSTMLLPFRDKHLRMFEYRYYKKLDTLHSAERLQECTQRMNDPASVATQPLAGIWINDYKTAIVYILPDPKNKNHYQAILLRSKTGNRLKPGMVSFTLQNSSGGLVTDYTDPQWGARTFFYSTRLNDSVLITGGYGKWKKIPAIDPAFDSYPSFSYEPTLQKIDSATVLLTIPEFESYNIARVDSLVRENRSAILHCRTLIIDIRYNLGGTIRVYRPLLPFICTAPIIRQGGYIYPTDDLVENQKKYIAKRISNGDTALIQKMRWELAQMLEHQGGRFFSPGDTIRCEGATPYPKQVAILTNYACQSAAEVMVLDCKQSSKVTVFGERTAGAVDFLDLYDFNTPQHNYLVNIPSVKRVAPAGQPKKLDATGIKPDVLIDDTVTDWVKWVINYYENN